MMGYMERGVLLPSNPERDPVGVTTRAAALGYDAVWTPELWGDGAFVRLAAIAGATDDLRLGTAIANVFSRSPAVLAAAAASLDRVSGGRFTLGLGVSTAKAVEDLHGMSFDRPVTRARETIELVRGFLGDDGPVDYDGEVFSVADFPPLDADVPIFHAALGRENRRVVGHLCDGWIPHNLPLHTLDDAFTVVADAAREVGRDPDEITVAPYVPTAVADAEAGAQAAIRGHVAYYVGSGEGYRRAVAGTFPEEAEQIATAWCAGDRDAARDAVTDEVAAALGVAGTPETAPDRFTALLGDSIIDHAVIVVPPGLGEADARLTLETLAP